MGSPNHRKSSLTQPQVWTPSRNVFILTMKQSSHEVTLHWHSTGKRMYVCDSPGELRTQGYDTLGHRGQISLAALGKWIPGD